MSEGCACAKARPIFAPTPGGSDKGGVPRHVGGGLTHDRREEKHWAAHGGGHQPPETPGGISRAPLEAAPNGTQSSNADIAGARNYATFPQCPLILRTYPSFDSLRRS